MKKIIFALVVAVAVAVGLSIKIGPDPVKMAKVAIGCPIVVNGVAERCN